MDQQKNLILAIVVSCAILFGFQYFLAPKAPPPQQQTTAQTTQSRAPASPPAPAAPATPAATPAARESTSGTPAATTASPAAREQILARTPRVAIDTPRLKGSINLVGAKLDDLTLLDYRENPDPSSPQIVLLAPDGTTTPYFAEFGWVPSDPKVKVPDTDTQWTSSGGALTPDHPIDLTWDNGAGLRFTRHYTVDDDYMFTVTQTVTNTGDTKVALYPYALDARKGEVPVSPTYLYKVGPIGVFDGSLDNYKYTDMKPDGPKFQSTGGWIGFTDKYWLTALIPDQHEKLAANFHHVTQGGTDVYQVDYRGDERDIAPGASATISDRFFAGAKKLALLDHYGDVLGIPHFDKAIDFGWLYFLAKPIFMLLDFFYAHIGNFGLSIMLLTVLIKLIFFPLANKSYCAMSKMRALQPEMQKLRERFGDDKVKLNQEMMALYKRVGANPMAGCLPIIIQLPVFYALYQVLYVTIEMRQAPFFGWIRDLSAPDPTNTFNLFGLLPFDPTQISSFLQLGIWPIIMGFSMYLQQRLNPPPPDPVQARLFQFMPVIFTFMLARFPAGLVIYWTWNNLLSIVQQWLIMRNTRLSQPRMART